MAFLILKWNPDAWFDPCVLLSCHCLPWSLFCGHVRLLWASFCFWKIPECPVCSTLFFLFSACHGLPSVPSFINVFSAQPPEGAPLAVFQWLPISLGIRAQVLTVTSKALRPGLSYFSDSPLFTLSRVSVSFNYAGHSPYTPLPLLPCLNSVP